MSGLAGSQAKLSMTFAEMQAFYGGTDTGNVIELMNQTNDILSDVPWIEANGTDGHKTIIRTGLPAVYWRRAYRGTPVSKSEKTQVKELCGILEARSEVDEIILNCYEDKKNAFRMSESSAFMESMRQKMANTLFYGDSNKSPEEFNGIGMRYPAKEAPNVIDAGGTGDTLTSIWLVSWGDNTVHGIYPKGSKSGLEHDDLGRLTVADEKGNRYEAVVDRYRWMCGLAVRDWRAVVRIANIDTEKLGLGVGEDGFIDFKKLLVKAKNLMPEHMRGKAVWYCNSEVMTALELQSSDPKGIHLTYGQYFNSESVAAVFGRPVRQCDAILSTEKAI